MLRSTTTPRGTARRGPDTRSLGRSLAAVLAAALVWGPAGTATAGSSLTLGMSTGTSTGTTPGDVTATVPSPASPLSWAPPALTSPTTVHLTAAKRQLKLDLTKDYVVRLPDTPLDGPHGVQIIGGRNVVLIGGTIRIPAEAITGTTHAGRGMLLKNQTGTVHIEGLHLTGPGLEEGINIDAAAAVVQLQNVRIDTVHGSYSGHHADVIQTWAGPKQLRIDGLTGHTQYQGLFLLPSQMGAAPPERFDLRRVDLHGTPTSAYMIWRDSQAWPLTVDEVFVAPKNPLHRDGFLWPKGTGQGTSAWPLVKVGSPPVGEFVPAARTGAGYRSPGYAAPAAPVSVTGSTLAVAERVVSPPVGALESVTPVRGGLRVAGWAADADATGPISVAVTVGGTTTRVLADRPRPAGAPTLGGAATGFDTVVPLPVGSHHACVTAVNVGSGSDTALGCRTGTVVDLTAPTVTRAPVLSLRTGTASPAGAFPVTAAWSTTDDVGVTGTRLTAPVTGTYAAGVGAADHGVGTGTSTWTLEASDAAGNVGTASSAATVTYVPETSTPRYNYWWTPSSSLFFGGSALRTNRGGAWMSHTFTGRSVAWVALKEAAGGRAEVYVDGVLEATVDLAAPTFVHRSVVFSRSWDVPGTHTVKVVAVGAAGKQITSDGFVTVR